MQILIHGLDVWNPITKTNLDNMKIACHRNEIKSLISPKLHVHLELQHGKEVMDDPTCMHAFQSLFYHGVIFIFHG